VAAPRLATRPRAHVAPSLSWGDAHRRRLERNHLVEPAPRERLVDVVRDLCGVQAQLLIAAELGLSARVAGLAQADVTSALWERRSLVRAWTVRGTIHLVPADDLPLWVAAVGARRYWETAEWLGKNELTRREADRVFTAIVEILDGRTMTRAELADAVVTRIGESVRQKITSLWGDLLGPVTYMGKLCFGPTAGAHVTFVRADQWIRGWRDIAPAEAWRELIHRYLRAYGPAPVDGIARWFGITPAEARVYLADVDAATVAVDGREAWILANDPISPRDPGSAVRLLPQYDAYVLGCRPRGSIVSEAAQARIRKFKRGQWEGAAGVPVLLLGGLVTGVWDRRDRRGRAEIVVQPAMKLTAAQRDATEREATRVATFLGREAKLEIVS
jgi:hypothetical protein